MQRVMCVWLPSLSIDLHRLRLRRDGKRGDARPILVCRTSGNRRLVHDCCAKARAAGVNSAMALAQARAIMPTPGPLVIEHSARHERVLLRRIAQRLHRFSPVVSIDEPDAILIDIAGCEHLFGGEMGLVTQARKILTQWGFTQRIATAPTPSLAWGLARFGDADALHCPRERARDFLARLPVAALRLEPRAAQALAELRIETIAQLMALERSAIARRFGGQLLLKLDQALGSAHTCTQSIEHAEPIVAFVDFEGPTTRIEMIELATRHVLERLCAQLIPRQQGALELTITLARSDLPPEKLRLRLTRPSADVQHLWKLAREHVSRAHMGFGVEGVAGRVLRHGLVRTEQVTFVLKESSDESDADANTWPELIDTLVARLGADRVCVAEPRASHDPVRCVRVRSVLDEPAPPAEWAHDIRARPTRLFVPALPARVVALTPDGPIHRLAWRDHEGPVLTVIGPERIEHEWWLGASSDACGTRDYFKVQDDRGVWLWVCRSHADGRWCVQGVWA